MADVELSSAARDALQDLPAAIVDRMQCLIQRLESWPAVSGAKPLRGELAGRYRLRTGDYRLQFRVESKKIRDRITTKETMTYRIIIEKVGHRDGFYE